MHRKTAIGAGVALVYLCGMNNVFGYGVPAEEPNVETEIVDIRLLRLIPQPPQPAARIAMMPQPQHPGVNGHEMEPPPSAQGFLPGVPFGVAASPAVQETNLWQRIRSRFTLEELGSPLVRDWETWYSSRPDYMSRMIARGERYLFHVVEEVEKRNMPAEIALLPMIESAYNPTAYSRAHASGMWQFIPSTGKNYGLKQNWWQDERRDVLAATRAALDYLEKLFEMFNSWELALAAYNWGEGAVQRAIQRNEARGLRTDYLSLDMPAETRNYLPKLMAVKNIVARPESFGLTLAEVPNRPYFTVVTTDRHIDVKLAAQLAEMPLDDFVALNPSHNRPVIRAESRQSILLPTDRVERFHANLGARNEPLTSWQSYTIGRQDRLEAIAERFGISLTQLKDVNGLSSRLRTLAGLTILVPNKRESTDGDLTAAGFVTPSAPEPRPSSGPQKHVVKAGESLALIAQRFGVNVAQLATRNGIRNGRLLAGQTLLIDGGTSQPVQDAAAQKTPSAGADAKASGKSKNVVVKKGRSGRASVAYTRR